MIMPDTEEELAVKLLSLFKTMQMDNSCYVQSESYGEVVYVKDGGCMLFELDEFTKHRLPTDRVLAVKYPSWLSDFALHADWILTPTRCAAMIVIKDLRVLFVFNNEITPDEDEFDSMLKYKNQWSIYVTETKRKLPFAIVNRHCRKLHLANSFNQLFKVGRV
nr:hypothetical protein [Vibrio parahaemolyticus]